MAAIDETLISKTIAIWRDMGAHGLADELESAQRRRLNGPEKASDTEAWKGWEEEAEKRRKE